MVKCAQRVLFNSKYRQHVIASALHISAEKSSTVALPNIELVGERLLQEKCPEIAEQCLVSSPQMTSPGGSICSKATVYGKDGVGGCIERLGLFFPC